MHRRRWHLTQEELAFLVGYLDQSIIARLEREERALPLAIAHAFHVLFGVEPRELFPALFESAEEGILARLHALHDRLQEVTASEKSAMKRKLLEQAIGRLTKPQEDEA